MPLLLHSYRTARKILSRYQTPRHPASAALLTSAPRALTIKPTQSFFPAITGFFLTLILAVSALPANSYARGTPGKFDYYSLVLSWSPTFCASPAGRNSQQQCRSVRKFAFVVHGLWPQYTRGWPEYCRKRPAYLSNKLIRNLYDIMPSKRLIIHQWKKHGSCSGLPARGYFSLTRDMFGQIKIPARYLSPNRTILTTPAQLREDFIKTNRWLKADMISVQCGNNTGRARLREVRVCFNRQGLPRNCGRNESRQCRANRLVLPPVR